MKENEMTQWNHFAATLNEMRDVCHQNAVDHGFHDTPPTVGESVALMHTELSELFEDFRAGKKPTDAWYVNKAGDVSLQPRSAGFDMMPGVLLKPCGIGSEAADVIIRVLDFCGLHGIDIGKAVAEKHAFNVTRPRLHGKVL